MNYGLLRDQLKVKPEEKEPRELLEGSTDLYTGSSHSPTTEQEDVAREQSRRPPSPPTTTHQHEDGGGCMELDPKAISLPKVIIQDTIKSYLVLNRAKDYM